MTQHHRDTRPRPEPPVFSRPGGGPHPPALRPRRRGGARALALSASVLLSACVTTIPLSTEPGPDDPGVRYLGSDGERAGRVFSGDSMFVASRLRVDPLRRELSLRVFPGDSVAVPLARISEIEFRNPARGALNGVGAALLVATVAGLTTAVLSDGDADRTRAEKGALAAAATAVFTVPIGFLIGMGGGHTTVLEVRPPR